MTGTLQTKKLKDGEYYYVVLYLYENGKRRPKWIPTGLPIKGNKKRWLGHANITMTANVYAHLDMKRKQSIADSLAGSLSMAWQREV